MLISNFSQAWAMYCLVLLYHEFQVKLKPHKPLKKFICVKAIVFFSFWQQVFIAMLVHFHVIDDEWQGQRLTTYNTDEVADGLQNLVICFEMFLFAIAHRYSFSYREYRAMMRAAARSSGGLATPQKPFMRAFIDSSVPETVSTTLNIGATAVTDGVKTVGGAVVEGAVSMMDGVTSGVSNAARAVTRSRSDPRASSSAGGSVGGQVSEGEHVAMIGGDDGREDSF